MRPFNRKGGRVLAAQHPGKGDEIECFVPLARQAVRTTGHDLPDVFSQKSLFDFLLGADLAANSFERFADKRMMRGREKAVGLAVVIRNCVQPARQRRCLER